LNYSQSDIDHVKLCTTDPGGNRHPCPLIRATFEDNYNIWPYLARSDDIKFPIYLLETIGLEFAVPYQNIQGFTFTIEGCNQLKQ
jgi:hypothetical protein